MIYNLSHTHSKGKFGEQKTMDKNPDGIVSKLYHGEFYLLSVKHGKFSLRVDSWDQSQKVNWLWMVSYSLTQIEDIQSFHGDSDYQYHPAGTVLAFTQE